MPIRFTWTDTQALWRASYGWLQGDGRGVAGSLALHALLLLLVTVTVLHEVARRIAPPPHAVPIDLVRLGDETTAPPSPIKAKIPQPLRPHAAPREAASANRPQGTTGTKPIDPLQTQLRALAQLKQPESNTKPLTDPGASPLATTNDAAPGNDATYAVRDLIRAQVVRRWTFNVAELAGRSFQIALRVTVLRNGTVAKAEILDRERYTRDALYRDIALSARNAVLLSSPLTLPAGAFGDQIQVTLTLNPRDTLR